MTWEDRSADVDPKLITAGELLRVAAEVIRRASDEISQSTLTGEEIHEVGQQLDAARLDVTANELVARGYGRAA